MSIFNPTPALPKYRGPYRVGSAEFEIPISEIDPSARPPSPEITTIKFRIFYPTDAKQAKEDITWVPSPQKQWIEAFSGFLGTSLGWSSIVNPLLSIFNFITIPALLDAPLLSRKDKRQLPLAIFSHGLAGNCNAYSSLCGSLASCGVISVAPEHRDGSCPITVVRSADGKQAAAVRYRKYSHSPTPEVFNARNAQLRTRLWELDLLYAALLKLNNGDKLSNYAHLKTFPHPLSLKKAMDFQSGRVSWIGHSFGGATITQFVKSIYHHKSLPSLQGTSHEKDEHWRPLYTCSSNQDILSQITPSSPVVLLDVWTLPFQAQNTQWLWEKPMPCYDRPSDLDNNQSNTVAVMSTEFYNWEALRNRTRALLSRNPVDAMRRIEIDKAISPQIPPRIEETPASPRISTPPYKGAEQSLAMTSSIDAAADQIMVDDLLPPPSLSPDSASDMPSEISRTHSPASASIFSDLEYDGSARSSQTDLSFPPPLIPSPTSEVNDKTPTTPTFSSTTGGVAPKLFYIPSSAHLSQSDFNLLFPKLVRVLMKAVDPRLIMMLNVRAITQAMRNAGVGGVRLVDEVERREGKVREKRGWAFWRDVDKEVAEEMVKERDVILDERNLGDGGNEVEGGRWRRLSLGN